MPEDNHISHVNIKIEGAPVSDEVAGFLVEVVIDHSLHLPSMFTLRLFTPNMRWLDDETFREGKKIEILAGDPPVQLMMGKIAALEPELDQDNPVLVVRGYDLSHRLYRGRQRRSFNNVTDDDLVRRLAQESGLVAGNIEAPPGAPHEYVFQNNQTNAEFLLERARRLGFELYVDGDRLNFHKPPSGGEALRLAWGETLRRFSARLSTSEQVNEVEVRGWDYRQKDKVTGRASRGAGEPQIGINQPGSAIANSAWGEAKIAIVDQFVRSPSEAETFAQAALDELSSAFVEAEGMCDGNPNVTPGKQVDVQGVGARFNGKYYITQVIHEWNLAQGLFTRFVASGRRDHGVWTLLEDAASKPPRMEGILIGIVTNNQDPDELGRVRVRIPALSENDESAWARVISPMAGNDRGMMYFPEIDDEVAVIFEHGDIHRPLILGALWNGRDKTPLSASDAISSGGQVNKRIIKSRVGHIILLDDTPGSEAITIVDKTGNNKLVLNSPDNSLKINTDGDLTIESVGKIKIKSAAGIEIVSDADVSVKGTSSATIEGTGGLTVKDGAGGQIVFNGPSVNINNGALEVT